ncbi:MAG TPA: twin-arginine translocation signal domain-containing protein, partial [Thermoguttaceae bacterium]|nr:twin-arginine translocation signal domain-containing protein [Thermoguttaceae bacterium]
MSHHTSRREFLKRSALAGTAVWVARNGRADETGSPNEKLNIGIIGVAGRGGANLNSVSSENIVALCDIDENKLGKAHERFSSAKTYVDWRKMLDQKDLDAV